MKKVVFVCLGNICRSPMAEFVMKSLTDDYEIESRATSSWEHGNPIHKGTQKIFKAHEIPYDSSKTSQQISKDDFEYFDYVIGMDESNLLDLTRMCPQDQQHKLEAFASEGVPDPWYTGDFDETYDRVLTGCQAWLTRLEMRQKMDNLKKFYDKYSVYITRPRLEIATVVVIALCAIFVFVGNMPKQGVLKLDGDSLVYDGSIVRGKMNGKGTMTFSNGDTYTGEFKNGAFNGKGTYQAKEGWVYEGDFVNGQAEGKGKLTTEQEVVYEGDFKQGLFQQAQ